MSTVLTKERYQAHGQTGPNATHTDLPSPDKHEETHTTRSENSDTTNSGEEVPLDARPQLHDHTASAEHSISMGLFLFVLRQDPI